MGGLRARARGKKPFQASLKRLRKAKFITDSKTSFKSIVHQKEDGKPVLRLSKCKHSPKFEENCCMVEKCECVMGVGEGKRGRESPNPYELPLDPLRDPFTSQSWEFYMGLE